MPDTRHTGSAHEVQRIAAMKEQQRLTSELLERVAAERDTARQALAEVERLIGARGPATVDQLAEAILAVILGERFGKPDMIFTHPPCQGLAR